MDGVSAMTARARGLPCALVRWRRWLLAGATLLCLLAGAGLIHLDYDTSLGDLLPAQDPYQDQREQLRERFPTAPQISFALIPDNGQVFSPPTLEALAELNRRFRQIPHARSMDSILNYRSPFGEVSLLPSPWNDMSRYSETQLDQAREQALSNPLVDGELVSPDTDLALARITLSIDDPSAARNRAMADASLRLRDTLEQAHPEVSVHVSSEALFEQSTRQAMVRDLTRLLPVVMALCALLVCYCFRSVVLGLSILAVAGLTVALTTGTLGWLGIAFNTVSIMAPLVVVIIAVADSVHIVSVHRQRLEQGASASEAMAGSLALNLRPVTLATLTTGVGFASLNLVSAPALSEFGSIVTLGTGYAWLVTMTILPGLIIATSGLVPATGHTGSATRLTAAPLRWCQGLVQRHGTALLGGVGLLTLAAVALLPLNRTDFNRMDFISTDSPVHDYYEAVRERLDRGPVLEYGIETAPGQLASPAVLRQVDRFAQQLREDSSVVSAASLVEVVKTVNQTLYGEDDPEIGTGPHYRIPDSAQAVRDQLNDYRQVEARGYPLERFVTTDLATMRVFISTNRLSNAEIVALDRRVGERFADIVDQGRLLHGSSTVLFARMDQAVTGELMRGYLLTLAIITGVLIVGLRSRFHGLLSVLPNALPAIIVFGFWGLFVGQLDPFVLMLFSVSIGLVVDDTVHVLSTWLRARRRGESATGAMREALHIAGPALIITTAVLALGTLVLTAASTLYFQQAARLLVPIVVLALILDLTFLPALLQYLEGRRPDAADETSGRS